MTADQPRHRLTLFHFELFHIFIIFFSAFFYFLFISLHSRELFFRPCFFEASGWYLIICTASWFLFSFFTLRRSQAFRDRAYRESAFISSFSSVSHFADIFYTELFRLQNSFVSFSAEAAAEMNNEEIARLLHFLCTVGRKVFCASFAGIYFLFFSLALFLRIELAGQLSHIALQASSASCRFSGELAAAAVALSVVFLLSAAENSTYFAGFLRRAVAVRRFFLIFSRRWFHFFDYFSSQAFSRSHISIFHWRLDISSFHFCRFMLSLLFFAASSSFSFSRQSFHLFSYFEHFSYSAALFSRLAASRRPHVQPVSAKPASASAYGRTLQLFAADVSGHGAGCAP